MAYIVQRLHFPKSPSPNWCNSGKCLTYLTRSEAEADMNKAKELNPTNTYRIKEVEL
jgi:hypothetical protein